MDAFVHLYDMSECAVPQEQDKTCVTVNLKLQEKYKLSCSYLFSTIPKYVCFHSMSVPVCLTCLVLES